MPLNYNDTPRPVEPPKADTDTTLPHGPGNRVAFDFAPVGPGDPKYLTGPPLAEINSIPYRGSGMAAHGIDTDTLTADYSAHPSPQESEAGNDGQQYEEWIAGTPLIVSVVDMPVETNEKYSRILQAYSAGEFYTFTAAGAFDNSPVRTLLPKDDTRTRATIFASPSPQFAAASGNGAQYAFLISADQACQTGILLGTNVANAPQQIEFYGKSPLFGRIVPLAAYDATKQNNYSLQIVAETSVMGTKKVR